MDVGRAFTFVTVDREWFTKVLIAGAIILANSFVPFVGLLVAGYMLAVIRNVYEGVDSPLPRWDRLGEYFVAGAIVTAGMLVWLLPAMLVAICPAIVMFSSDQTTSLGLIYMLCFATPLVLAIAVFVLPLVFARFAIHREFSAMFRFDEVFTELRAAAPSLLLVFLISIAAFAVAVVAGAAACLVGLLVTLPFAYLVYAHLIGQMYRRARGLQPLAGQTFGG
jgi:hypothetical protein